MQPNTCCFHHLPTNCPSPQENPTKYPCAHTQNKLSLARINAVLKSHMEHHQSSGLSRAEGKCPADLMPIKKISLPSVNGLLSSFPFFHFLISLLSLQKKFSTALKRLQVLFILPLFSPQFYFFPASLRGFLVWVFFFLFFFLLFLLKQLIYCSPTCWERLTCY